MGLQFRSRHRNEFGFGLGGLAHDGGFPAGQSTPQVAVSVGICREGSNVITSEAKQSTATRQT
jgi:hypothetical protein